MEVEEVEPIVVVVAAVPLKLPVGDHEARVRDTATVGCTPRVQVMNV